jgi:hypothetical protein
LPSASQSSTSSSAINALFVADAAADSRFGGLCGEHNMSKAELLQAAIDKLQEAAHLLTEAQNGRSKGLKGHWLECEICQELDC